MRGLNLRLNRQEYQLISDLMHDRFGINLHEGKRELIKARLGKVLRREGIDSYGKLYDMAVADQTGHKLNIIVNALTTNVTHFFREQPHFDFISKVIMPEFVEDKKATVGNKLRVWSAGCSSGEEPYSIAFTITDYLQEKQTGDADVKILATDISMEALSVAEMAVYKKKEINIAIPLGKKKYFEPLPGDNELLKIRENISCLTKFRYLNLNGTWPMKNLFDIIFCRNVMIYFSPGAKKTLISRIKGVLKNDGYFFIGHSESINNMSEGFEYIAPGIYRKKSHGKN